MLLHMKDKWLNHRLNNFENKIKIKNIFKTIGAAAATANLLCEFSIAEKDKLTNNRKGNVILVREIVRSNLSELSEKPGAIIKTNDGIKISITNTINNNPISSKLKILFANFWALFYSNLIQMNN